MQIIGTFDPPNNTLVVRHEGVVNVALECRFSLDDDQQTTQWAIANFVGRSLPRPLRTAIPSVTFNGTARPGSGTYRNILIIPQFIAELHGAIIYCGVHSNFYLGQFHLRVYRKLVLVSILCIDMTALL